MNGAMDRLISSLIEGLYRAWYALKRNKRVSAILYRKSNQTTFSYIDQHERMLADRVRTDTYHAAIHKHVAPGDTVVDVGTGTGILSLFAAQNRPKYIYAIDHSEIIELAQNLAAENGAENISFLKIHSAEFSPPHKATVILHEQIGDFLLDEDMIRNICELRDRILVPGGKILPSRFDLFLEPIALKAGSRRPFLWEQDIQGVRFAAAAKWLESAPGSVLRAAPYHMLTPDSASHFLCEPEPILSFDLETLQPEALPQLLSMHKQVLNSGKMDGFCLYFTIRFDDELALTTSPFDPPTHWRSQIFRTALQDCSPGDLISLSLQIEDHTRVNTWRLDYRVHTTAKPAASTATA